MKNIVIDGVLEILKDLKIDITWELYQQPKKENKIKNNKEEKHDPPKWPIALANCNLWFEQWTPPAWWQWPKEFNNSNISNWVFVFLSLSSTSELTQIHPPPFLTFIFHFSQLGFLLLSPWTETKSSSSNSLWPRVHGTDVVNGLFNNAFALFFKCCDSLQIVVIF